jgi:hypothetical protein
MGDDVNWIEQDFFWSTLVLESPALHPPLRASVRVTQPQGYRQSIEIDDVRIEDGSAYLPIRYPFIDDGRYDASHGTWNGAWEMGRYVFEAEVRDESGVAATCKLTVDPNDFFPRDHRYVISVDSRKQFVECAPRQSLYMGEDPVHFTIRIREHRVSRCHVEVDVTGREGDARLAGPWRYALTDAVREESFPIAGWEDGEYWIRIRVVEGGKPMGPYMVRKFWIQGSVEAPPPDVLDLHGQPEILVDDYALESQEGIQFVPAAAEASCEPMTAPTEPHEEAMLRVASMVRDEEAGRFVCRYGNMGCSAERKPTFAEREHLVMEMSSVDGITWEKPRLGQVAYHGSTDNNIRCDKREQPTAEMQERERDLEHAVFRFYDSAADGDINIDHVFVASGKGYFPFQCNSLQDREAGDALARIEDGQQDDMREDGLGVMDGGDRWADDDAFRPVPGEFWPMEKRGDTYLVLSREPILYLGIGMDLMHTSESIRSHVERFEGGKRRLFYYFRPGSPSYPPLGAPCDNMHMIQRVMAVLWTDDGLHYERRFVLGPDRYDPVGSQYYDMDLFHTFDGSGEIEGRPVIQRVGPKRAHAVPRRNLYPAGTLMHWGIEQTEAPEFIWTRDLIHFHRFKERRRSFIPLGAGGSFAAGMVRPRYMYWVVGDEWWHAYTGINTRHNGYGVFARQSEGPDALREAYPSHYTASYFSTWEGHYADGKSTQYLPGIARTRANRFAFAEPEDLTGTLTTRPVRVERGNLTINAETEPGGHIAMDILDPAENIVLATASFEGDEVHAGVADLSAHKNSAVRIRFQLDRARLYAFCV